MNDTDIDNETYNRCLLAIKVYKRYMNAIRARSYLDSQLKQSTTKHSETKLLGKIDAKTQEITALKTAMRSASLDVLRILRP
jgi:hypothetical protein